MQPANRFARSLQQVCSPVVALTALLVACEPMPPHAGSPSADAMLARSQPSLGLSVSQHVAEKPGSEKLDADQRSASESPLSQLKTEGNPGEFIGPAIDCDGDGLSNEARIDFDGDGTGDECVVGPEDIPEPPFQQTYTPTSEGFYAQLPAVGWTAQYQCGDGLYDVILRRPSEGTLEYVSDGLTLSSTIVYDDIDPNLNQPMIIQDPQEGVRYSFEQERDGEYYEYAIANYGGSVGLYVYQTGEQVVAAPCSPVSSAAVEDSRAALTPALTP
ncbi:MAG: hypothetical protein AAF171_26345 [Cyanobacteria bacterium P01_A01_bin.116]